MPGRRRQKRTDRSKLDATPPWEQRIRAEPVATTGPYDERDAPQDDVPRIDLGALRIPVDDSYDLRVDLDDTHQVIAATLATTEGTMQLGVFAAPRAEGLWDEVRSEIAASLEAQRHNSTREQEGEFGTELHGVIPAEPGPGVRPGTTVAVRFLGVDGPRWFLRALLAGPAAAEPAKAKQFEEALRGVVVVRGTAPLPVREPVPLQLPAGVELPGT